MREPPDPIHSVKLAVTVLDTVTGERREDGRGTTWDWTEGNWSCDCNRADAFEEDEWETGVCAECRRFLAVAVTPMLPSYSLADFNDGYPRELVERFLGADAARLCYPRAAG